MKHLREELWFNTPHRRDYINITDKVEELVKKSGVQHGLVGLHDASALVTIVLGKA